MQVKIRWRGAAWAAAVIGMPAGWAQVPPVLPPAIDPGVIQQRQMEEERRRREEEREQRRVPAEPLRREAPAAAPLAPAAEAVRFRVREVRFTESAILSAEELAALAGAYANRELSLADLRELADKVNARYREKGVVTAQATVPPQDVSSGIVVIRLVEGRLGRILLHGNGTTHEDYVTDRLGLKPADLMDLSRLEASLIRFNRTNDSQLRAELKPGDQFATTDMLLEMIEPARHELRLTLDNLGATATGRNRLGAAYTNRSLFGYRDELGLSDTKAQGQNSASATYGFPVNTWGGRVNLGYYEDTTAVKKGPVSILGITGRSAAEVVSFRQPTLVGTSAQVDVVGGAKHRRSISWIGNTLYTRTDTSDRSLGAEAQIFGTDASWFGSYTRYFGHSDGLNLSGEGYRVDRGSLRHFRDIGAGYSFRGIYSWQSVRQADLPLPSSEQFFIGGEGSVRAYPVGTFSGDRGQTLNLELHHPLVRAGGGLGDLSANGFFFADYGRVKPVRPPNSRFPEFDILRSAGWGVNVELARNLGGRLTFGYGPSRYDRQPRHYEVTMQLIASVF